ncbi:Hsp20 family protein [Enterobacter hormaechei]
MKIYRPLWEDGAFLAPQQFQQQARWDAHVADTVARMALAHPWGVLCAEFDEGALALSRLNATRLCVRFADGTLVDTDLADNRYELTLSVPGWKESELEIETVGVQLNISGKREEEKTENGEEGWIHRGISRSDFRASYSLPEHVKVTGASLENGLLAIELHQDIPEEEKPQRIAINNNPAIEHKP